MSFTYCQSCGNKNLYSLALPKFCGSCGISLGSKRVSGKKIGDAPSGEALLHSDNTNVDDPDGVDVYEVPDIGQLKCTFSSESPTGSRKMSLKDLVSDSEELIDEVSGHESQEKKKTKRARAQK
jgi:hypothetical protein